MAITQKNQVSLNNEVVEQQILNYYDPKATTDKNAWSAIDVAHVETFAKSRLSVMPVTAEQWAAVTALR